MVNPDFFVPQQSRASGYGMFMDGDLVVISLPDRVDSRLYGGLHHAFELIQRRGVRQLLLDFSGVNEVAENGIAALRNLNILVSESGVHMLILDAPGHISDRLEKELSVTTFVESGDTRQPVLYPAVKPPLRE